MMRQHCANGKNRTGILVSCFLKYMGAFQNTSDAFDSFCAARFGILPGEDSYLTFALSFCYIYMCACVVYLLLLLLGNHVSPQLSPTYHILFENIDR